MDKKTRFHVKIDVAENGYVVTVKDRKEIVGSRVFEGKGEKSVDRWKKWSEGLIKEREDGNT